MYIVVLAGSHREGVDGRKACAARIYRTDRRGRVPSSPTRVRTPAAFRLNPRAVARAAVTSPAESLSQSTQDTLSDSEQSQAEQTTVTGRQQFVRQFDFKHGEAQQAVLRGAYLTGHNENDLHCFLAACRAAERHRQVVAPKRKMWNFF